MNKTLALISLGLLLGSLSACYKDNEEELYPSLSTCDTASVSYASHIAPIIQSACLGCHSNTSAPVAGAGIALEGHGNLSSYISSNETRFIGTLEHTAGFSAMPKGGSKLDNCKINQIKVWINNGAQNN